MSEPRSRKIWRRLAIAAASIGLILVLLLSAVTVVLSTQPGSQWALARAVQNANTGGSLSVAVENVRGTIFRGLSFGSLRISNESGTYILEDLRTSWNPYSLLTGQLYLSDVWMSSLRIEASSEGQQDSELDLSSLSNSLPIDIAISSLRAERIEFVQDEVYTLRSVAFGAELNKQQLSLDSLELSFEGAELAGEIALGLSRNIPVSAQLDWSYTVRIAERDEVLSGSLQLTGDLAMLQIEHQLESPQQIRSAGSLTTGLAEQRLAIDLLHSASGLILPFEVQVDYAFSDISLRTTGNLEEISLDLQAAVQVDQYPSLNIDTQGSYTESLLTIDAYNISASDNAVTGAVTIDWSDVPHIVGSYELDIRSIGTFINLPVSLSLAELQGVGSYDVSMLDAGAEGRLTIDTVSGQLVDYPLQGQGAILFRQGVIDFNDLQLLTQSNQLNINGSYSDVLDINWAISAASLQEFLPGSSGVLEGQGKLRGNPIAPDIVGTLSGRGVTYQQVSSDQFVIDFQRIDGQVRGEAAIDTLRYIEGPVIESLASIKLMLSGSESNHTIDLSAQSRFGDIAAKASGSITQEPELSWLGRLASAEIDTPLGTWATRSSTDLAFNETAMSLGESCWSQQAMVLCFALENLSAAGIIADGSLQNFPLSIFNSGGLLNSAAGPKLVEEELLLLPQLPEGALLQGQAGGEFSVEVAANSEMLFEFRLAASDALLLVMQQEDVFDTTLEEVQVAQEFNLELLELAGNLDAGAWQLHSEARFLRENLDDSEIDVRGELSVDVGIGVDRGLNGTVDAGLQDLSWLQALVPELSNISGSLDAHANLDGSLDSPELSGVIELADASVTINRLGIEITEIFANISSDNPESVGVTGSAKSDTGSIEFTGEILNPFGASSSLSAEVRGTDFQLASVPNLHLHVSPNVVLNANANTIEVTGSLDVPILNLTLEQLPETAVDVSRDVVIVSYPSDRPDLAYSLSRNETTFFDRPLSGVVDITLGDDVTFTGFGMNTNLTGNLNIQQTAEGSNLTYGELTLADGMYEMYGQSLDISQGKFLFFGAYDNPGIDVRATRKVDNMTVGVLMNGTLKNISSQLFSTPALADNEILAVLVTGKRFSDIGQQDSNALLTSIASLGIDRSQGLSNQVRSKLGLDVLAVDPTDDINNSVLTIGKYLTPDIFVRYGVGLFDNQSKVAVDYTLSERLKLQAESGEYQSVDIIYSVER